MKNQLLAGLVVAMMLAVSPPALGQVDPGGEGEVHSKIDGQLVPVGEHNKYKYAYKKHNVSTNPLAWFMGTFSVGYTYAFHRNFALRVDAGFVHFWKTPVYGGRLSASVPIYVKKVHDGFYLEPGAYMLGLGIDGASAFAGGPMLLLGWGWIWDSGFNLNLGFGMTYTWVTAEGGGSSAQIDGPFPTGRFAFGYAW